MDIYKLLLQNICEDNFSIMDRSPMDLILRAQTRSAIESATIRGENQSDQGDLEDNSSEDSNLS